MYHSFVSWPHVANPEVRDCAERLRRHLQEFMAPYIAEPRVFLDTSTIRPGEAWERRLESALCRSLTMVAVCAPMYYHPDHRWCGREWAGMERLNINRLGDLESGCIVPVIFRKRGPFPPAVEKYQYIDISTQELQGPAFYRTQAFRGVVRSVVETVWTVAELLRDHDARSNCDDFTLPAESAFDNYAPPQQPSPFRRTPDAQRRHTP